MTSSGRTQRTGHSSNYKPFNSRKQRCRWPGPRGGLLGLGSKRVSREDPARLPLGRCSGAWGTASLPDMSVRPALRRGCGHGCMHVASSHAPNISVNTTGHESVCVDMTSAPGPGAGEVRAATSCSFLVAGARKGSAGQHAAVGLPSGGRGGWALPWLFEDGEWLLFESEFRRVLCLGQPGGGLVHWFVPSCEIRFKDLR